MNEMAPNTPPEMPVDIIRSPRRRRTVQSYLSEGRLRVMVPAGLHPDEEAALVDTMVAKTKRKLTSTRIDLMSRCEDLASKYGLAPPTEIEWSERQKRRWGSCSPSIGRIRISTRLAAMPGWVLDSVLIHEMAHLAEPDHGEAFRRLVDRYELGERAKGYLMAMEGVQE
ncbi:MAG: DUF45 domain-containing protein [Acidimicrobiia bacterium]|nr:DUF45 domain-containing protein [Acidimicrobiia bacterium]